MQYYRTVTVLYLAYPLDAEQRSSVARNVLPPKQETLPYERRRFARDRAL